jgi:hypothetical protein
MKWSILILISLFINGCAPVATPTPATVIRVHSSSAAQPWLTDMYACADRYNVLLVVDNLNTADVALSIGESTNLSSSAYQIDQEEVLVVTHPQVEVNTLTVDQVRAIYTGQVVNWSELGGGDQPIDVWTYPAEEDIQQIFDRTVLDGLKVTPRASLAVSAQNMSDSVGINPGAIGILPRRWKTGNTHETLILATTPVLAITRSEPKDPLEKVLSCIQK